MASLRIVGSMVLILASLTPGVRGQESRFLAAKGRLLNLVIINLRDGSLVSGRLIGVEGDSLVLRRGDREERIPRRQISRTVIEAQVAKTNLGLIGALAASYGWLTMNGKGENQPTAYLGTGEDFNLFHLVIPLTGAALGILARPLLGSDKAAFMFSGSNEDEVKTWSRLVAFIKGDSRPRRFALSLQGGSVFGMDMDKAKASVGGMGFSLYGFYSDPTGSFRYWEDSGGVNMLRSLRASLSLSRRLRVGVTVCFAGQPAFAGMDYTYDRYRGIAQTFSSTGYFVTAGYELLAGRLGARLRWEAGGGAGLLHYRLGIWDFSRLHQDYGPSLTAQESWSDSGIRASGLVYTTLTYDVDEFLSLGVMAESMLAPGAVEMPERPLLGIPARSFRLGSGCAGWVMGIRF